MKIYKLPSGTLLQHENQSFIGPELDWDILLSKENLKSYLSGESKSWKTISQEDAEEILSKGILSPMGNQEIWAAGVTYYRSRTARMEESEVAGGADFYDKVYHADRPELFFKATASRVSAPGRSEEHTSELQSREKLVCRLLLE